MPGGSVPGGCGFLSGVYITGFRQVCHLHSASKSQTIRQFSGGLCSENNQSINSYVFSKENPLKYGVKVLMLS